MTKTLSISQITETIIEEGYTMTDNFYEAIYMLADGSMISGDFDYGVRGTDHHMIECVMDSDRYDDNFWDDVHTQLNIIRLVPETEIALIKEGQELTEEQQEILKEYSYELEVY
ncbi:hypothetical protein [Bacillus sp. Bos-x628]|uniref:hypothetical protein n=1 Tax=Bacillus maqinnsis TaxID=3229854 RepID=UPI00338EF1B9